VLHIHRAERADGLVEALRALLLDPLTDPFASEVIAVPTRGMERWLTQRMSERLGASAGRFDGVCANVAFPSPRRLVGDAVAAASGVEPAEDPWLPERAVWPLLEVVDACLGEPWLHSLSAHLGGATAPPDPVRRARRFSTVRHLAGLFDRYALHRPEMVNAWAGGLDTNGSGEPLPPNAAWQSELWRRLRARIALPGPAERRESACSRVRDDASILDLPERVSLFGLTRLPTGHLHVLSAVAERREVHLFLLHPSPALWDAIAQATRGRPRIVRRGDDPTADLPANRLLASWGRDAREMQLVLGGSGEHAEHHHPLELGSDTLLARIQADVRADRPPPGAPLPGQADARPLLDPADGSLQIHSCHGRARQVEVVRDAILHMLAEDASLEPRDVIVMCPDIETFAPLVQATFGAGELSTDEDALEPLPAEPRAVDLRVRLADRSLRQTNPLLAVVAQLLDLAEQRLTASQVLDLADREPVRRRFRLDDGDLTRLQSWIGDAGIRWGLDAAHRAPFKLDGLAGGTWRAGLDRLLVGVTMTEDEQRLFHDVLPLDDVDSGAIDLAGRFAELIARLEEAIDALGTPKPIEAWAEAIGAAADSLTATREREEWQRSELQRVLDDLVEEATVGDSVTPTTLAPAEVRALLAERLQGRPTRANFRTGHLTICTLVPMRSVPHRVVCLLGLDDGAFPRKAPRDGDDLMLDDPHVGERDPRTEDRQLLLDALLAASERLIVTYTGNDERTNSPRPAAVPVGELLDIVDTTVPAADGPAREQVVVRHPLQPFDPRNFARGALVRDASWSFDPVTLEGARALTGPRSEPGPFLAAPLPRLDPEPVELDDLVRFVQHPVRAFLRRRLRIGVGDFSDELEDRLRVELDGLERWAVGQRLLDARLAGVGGRTAILAEIARGTLPPGVLGRPVIDRVYPTVDAIVAEAAALAAGEAARDPVDIRVTLADGQRVSGTVAGVRGDVLLTTTYSRVSAKHRLAAWVRLLALTAADPERAPSAATVGRGDAVTIARIRPLAADAEGRRQAARDHLSTLVDLYGRGMREPLPLYCLTSAAYAEAAAVGRDPVAAARGAWTSPWNYDKEDKEPEHQLVLAGVRAFDELLAEPARPDEGGPGWETSETTRLGRYARRLWGGLLAREEVTTR
jgi:exodeoxyribonuclease V gamma subunit